MKLSDRTLAGRPEDLAAENRELHQLRAQVAAVRSLADGLDAYEYPDVLSLKGAAERIRLALGAST